MLLPVPVRPVLAAIVNSPSSEAWMKEKGMLALRSWRWCECRYGDRMRKLAFHFVGIERSKLAARALPPTSPLCVYECMDSRTLFSLVFLCVSIYVALEIPFMFQYTRLCLATGLCTNLCIL